MGYAIDVLPAADIDRLEVLGQELLSHHLRDAPHLAALGTARTPEDSWRVRRGQYLQWLAAPRATLLTPFRKVMTATLYLRTSYRARPTFDGHLA